MQDIVADFFQVFGGEVQEGSGGDGYLGDAGFSAVDVAVFGGDFQGFGEAGADGMGGDGAAELVDGGVAFIGAHGGFGGGMAGGDGGGQLAGALQDFAGPVAFFGAGPLGGGFEAGPAGPALLGEVFFHGVQHGLGHGPHGGAQVGGAALQAPEQFLDALVPDFELDLVRHDGFSILCY